MRRKLLILFVIAAVVGATGIASARIGGMGGYYANGDNDWANQMYQWMGQHMGRWGGHMMGYGQPGAEDGFCQGIGNGNYESDNPNTVVVTQDEAVKLIESAVNGTITSDVYQMGRWFVAFYEGADGKTRQARVDIFTGEVYEDFFEDMSGFSRSNSNNGYGGMGRMMRGY
ncbi:MAG: hypothetical protein M8353_08250 [ANME-2 cluster archaeon]|nr:hypothetical protein [ANME-2 cluster archaeon]